MVDKKNTKKSTRAGLDKHNYDAGARFIFLEERIEQFINIIHVLSKDMEEMKQQQQAIIELVKNAKEK